MYPVGGETQRKRCIKAEMRSRLYDIKTSVEEALSISAREQRLILESHSPWDDARMTLGDMIRKMRRPQKSTYQLQVLRYKPDTVQ
eukprot:2024979-Amphidinium_carterae.1